MMEIRDESSSAARLAASPLPVVLQPLTALPRAREAGAPAGHPTFGGPRQSRWAHHWQRRYLWLTGLVDVAAVLLADALVVVFRPAALQPFQGESHKLAAVSGLSVLWVVMLLATGAYDGTRLRAGRCNIRRVMQAGATAGFIAAVSSRLTEHADILSFVSYVIPLGVALQIAGRAILAGILRKFRAHGRCLFDIVVIGGRDQVARVTEQALRSPGAGWRVIAACISEGQPDQPIPTPDGPLMLFGPCTAMAAARVARESGAAAVAVIAGALGPGEMRELAWDLERDSLRLLLVHDLAGITHSRLMALVVGDSPLLEVRQPAASRWVKSASDRILAAGLLLLLGPVFFLLAVIVRVDSKGPAFFRQTRVGRHGRIFVCWKFRSMYVDAEERLADLARLNDHDGVLFKMRQDPRITRAGRLLRKYSLDELPQLFNVLGGSMSLVGPRPSLPSEVAVYHSDARRRLKVKPGITGLWQVSGRSDLSWSETVRLDSYYVENWSHALDWHILARTVSAVIAGRGAY